MVPLRWMMLIVLFLVIVLLYALSPHGQFDQQARVDVSAESSLRP